jgi:hypothetical protein
MFRLLHKAIFKLELKRCFDIQLAVSLKYEISFTLECEIQKCEIIHSIYCCLAVCLVCIVMIVSQSLRLCSICVT